MLLLDLLSDKDNFYEDAQNVGNCVLWSSTESTSDTTSAVTVNVNTKISNSNNKTALLRARAIRVFTSKPVDYSNAKVGDIVLANGLLTSPDEYCSGYEAAAIICKASANAIPLGISVKEGSGLAWCTQEVQGYKEIKALIGDVASGLKFSSDAYELLYSAAPDVLTNSNGYPAWKFCLTYGKDNNFKTMLTNWTLPTATQLAYISPYVTTINNSLSKVHGDTISTNASYLSCNQIKDTSKNIRVIVMDALIPAQVTRRALLKEVTSAKVRAVREFENEGVTKETVATPTFDPPSGSDGLPFDVTINCDTVGATIYYKLNNGEYQEYTAGEIINVRDQDCLRAIALAEGKKHSAEAKVNYYKPVY